MKKQKNDFKNNCWSALITITTLAITLYTLFFFINKKNDILLPIVIVIAASFAIIIPVLLYLIMSNKNREDEIEAYSEKLKRALSPKHEFTLDQNNLETTSESDYSKQQLYELQLAYNTQPEQVENKYDVLGIMWLNLVSIKRFYTSSQKQADYSFILAMCMCVVGFILMAVTISFTLISNLSSNAAIIAVIGSAVVEVIAGTSLWVYQKSLSQLNYYHKYLHENERFLSSVSLISKLNNEETQDEMLAEIIRSTINMNLMEIENNKNENAKKSE